MFGLAILPLLNESYFLCSTIAPSLKQTSISSYLPYRIIVASIPQFIIRVSPRRFSAETLMFGLVILPFLNVSYALCSTTFPSSKQISMSEYFPYRIIVAFIPQFIIRVSPRQVSAEALMFGLEILPFLNALYVLCFTTVPSSKCTSISVAPPYRIMVASIPQFIIRVSPSLSIFVAISYPSLFVFDSVLT